MNNFGRVATETRSHVMIATLDGEFDMSNSDELRRRIADAIEPNDLRRLVVDLSGVSFLDSATVHLLLGLNASCRERNIALRIVAPTGSRAGRVLEMAGADKAIAISASIDDALAES
jgi:anti-anti-sigma factor